MQSIPLAEALAAVALAVAVVAAGFAFAARRGAAGDGRRSGALCVFFACGSVSMLAGSVLALAHGVHQGDAAALDAVAVLAKGAVSRGSSQQALSGRLDEVAEGLRTELSARDHHRTRVEERVQALADDVHELQLANTVLRRMLVGVAGTSGLLITREGRYRIDSGKTTFTPCGWGEAWDLKFSPGDDAREELASLLAGRHEATVSFTGVLSTPGRFGDDGALRHLFLVIDGTPADDAADCR
jgi:hypothetical protein